MDKEYVEVLNLIQSNFPIESRPYLKIANELNMTEEQVINIIRYLKDNGYIRRLGGVFNSKKLGYYSTLCAVKVPKERIQEVATLINDYIGVTHNYIRNHEYNMWFTVIASTEDEVKKFINGIKSKTEIQDIISLPSINLFKINVNFNINLREEMYV